jgi:formyl-CoA transferase
VTTTGHIFSGLKVLDLASYIAGPAATTILADFGADVVKVEPPKIGDAYRYFSQTPPNPVSSVKLCVATHQSQQAQHRDRP